MLYLCQNTFVEGKFTPAVVNEFKFYLDKFVTVEHSSSLGDFETLFDSFWNHFIWCFEIACPNMCIKLE